MDLSAQWKQKLINVALSTIHRSSFSVICCIRNCSRIVRQRIDTFPSKFLCQVRQMARRRSPVYLNFYLNSSIIRDRLANRCADPGAHSPSLVPASLLPLRPPPPRPFICRLTRVQQATQFRNSSAVSTNPIYSVSFRGCFRPIYAVLVHTYSRISASDLTEYQHREQEQVSDFSVFINAFPID